MLASGRRTGGPEKLWPARHATGILHARDLNLLPVPGLDGWGALEPWLPARAVDVGRKIGGFGALLVFLVLFQFPAVSHAFWSAVYRIGTWFDLAPWLSYFGYRATTFWH